MSKDKNNTEGIKINIFDVELQSFKNEEIISYILDNLKTIVHIHMYLIGTMGTGKSYFVYAFFLKFLKGHEFPRTN